jgi:hypothetical protein
MQHLEATSGASRTARGRTGTLAAHGAGEDRRGMRRHPSRGRSGLRTMCGGQTAQDAVRLSNMDGERDLSAPGGQQVADMHPLEAAACFAGSVKKAVA